MKDKRTKQQILKLLDKALTQEEMLSEKIQRLEGELTDCRKKAEDPRHELKDEALAASKVSFRIDYYRTSEDTPLKGIIEHLPSRRSKSFEGEGTEVIASFIGHYLSEEPASGKKRQIPAEKTPEPEITENFPDEEWSVPAGNTASEPGGNAPGLLQRLQQNFAAQEEGVPTVAGTESIPRTSRLLSRLREEYNKSLDQL